MATNTKDDIDDLLADAINDFDLDNEAKTKTTNKDQSTPKMDEFLQMLNSGPSSGATAAVNTMPSEAELEQMFSEFASQASGAASSPDFLPVLESMMKSILSKDLLYPPLKDLCDKYPDWLADQRPKMTETEFDNYNQQYQIATELVATFEQSKEDFDKVLELMQKMQSYGHPPKELVGNTPPQALDSVPQDCKLQ